MKPWRTVSSQSVHKNPWSEVTKDSVIRPDGTPGTYYVIKRLPFCGIIPVDEQGRVYLIRQMRYPIRRNGWEIPQGAMDPGDDHIATARRELEEEAGIRAVGLEHIGEIAAEKGLQDSFGQIYVATGLHMVDSSEEQAIEGISACEPFTKAELHRLYKNGEIQCSFTASALYLAEILHKI